MKQSIHIWKMPFVVKSAFPGQQTQAINPSSNVVLQETNIQGLDYWAPEEVLGISSDGDDRRIFWVWNFRVQEYFG